MCEMSCVRSTVSAAEDGGRRTPAGGMQARKQKPHSDVGKKMRKKLGHEMWEKISFGGIPNSRPYAIFDCMGVFLRSGFAHVDNVIPVIKAITWLLLSRLQGNKPHRNFPEPSEPYLLNLRQHTPEPSEIFRNLPELACGTYTILHRNSPEPSGTCLRNIHHFTKELSGTFWNPPPEPTPAHSGTFRNLPPEPAPATRIGTHRSLSGLKTPLAYAVGE